MNPNGSTVTARFKEPCKFVRLPIDLRVSSEDERRQRLALRKPQVKQIKEVTMSIIIILLRKFSGIDRRQFRRGRLFEVDQ